MNTFYGQVSPEYLETAATLFSSVKQESYRKMHVAEGDSVLDIGCGPGLDAMALAELVGNQGKVVGLDQDRAMLTQASQNLVHTYQNREIDLIQGCASQLPFPDNYFSSCRSERLFMHLTSPEQTLSEIRRVTRPGGRIVVVDTDWASLSIDNSLPKIEQALANYRISQVLNNGYSGRSLYRQFRKLQLTDIKIDIYPICVTDIELFYYLSMQQAVEDQAMANRVITKQELKYWRKELNRAVDNDCFFCNVNIIMVSASKTV